MNIRVEFFMDITPEKFESIQRALVSQEHVLADDGNLKDNLARVISSAFQAFFEQYGETKGLIEKGIEVDPDGLLGELHNTNVIRPFLLTETRDR